MVSLIDCEHSFVFKKDTVLYEIKQGPYIKNEKIIYDRVFEPKLGLVEKFIYNSINKGFVSSSGPSVQKFEKNGQIIDRKYGVSVSNGTVALQLALKLLDLKKMMK